MRFVPRRAIKRSRGFAGDIFRPAIIRIFLSRPPGRNRMILQPEESSRNKRAAVYALLHQLFLFFSISARRGAAFIKNRDSSYTSLSLLSSPTILPVDVFVSLWPLLVPDRAAMLSAGRKWFSAYER